VPPIRRTCLPFLFTPFVGLATFFLLCVGAPAADDAPAGRKYALLVGVRNYDKDQLRSLRYTENDVNGMAAVLKDAGYKRVVLMTQAEAANAGDNTLQPTAKNIRKKLAAILEDRKPEDAVLIAFSGHSVQFRDQKASYFCPMDADLADDKTLVSLGEVYKSLEESQAGTKVLLVDACRNDPQAEASKAVEKIKLESVTRPQAERPPGGVAALFSCSEGQSSYESEKLGHGVFFNFVIEGLKGEAANKKGEVTLQRLAAYVADEVPDAAREVSDAARQRPQQVGDLSGAIPLVTAVNREEIVNTIGMKLKRIKAGKFLMGSPKDEEGRYDNEGPQHEVEITKAFYMGAHPVTRGQFAAFVKAAEYQTEGEADGTGGYGLNLATAKWEKKVEYTWRHPGFLQTADHAVVEVSWNDATAFCAWLSKKEGKIYELPTEAEWEYACRAGAKTRFWCGDEDASLKGNANMADASLKEKVDTEATKNLAFVPWDDGSAFTSPVGSFKANPWGLYDMHGNVWQWCADYYDGKYYENSNKKDPLNSSKSNSRVLRGGSWGHEPRHCRSAGRGINVPANRLSNFGFRVVLRSPARTP
jgi:sulfatase modifying factor 1